MRSSRCIETSFVSDEVIVLFMLALCCSWNKWGGQVDTKLYEAVSWINKILQHCQFTPPRLTVFRRWRGGGGGGGNSGESQRTTAGLHRWRRRWKRRRSRRQTSLRSVASHCPLYTWGLRSCRALIFDPTFDPCLFLQRKGRRRACGRCAACLREDCGKCLYCLDKRKFGGPEKKKQRCQLRVCLVVVSICGCLYWRLLVRTGAAALLLSPPQESNFRPRPPQTNLTVTTATEPQHHRWRRGRDENEEEVRDPCWSQLCLIYFVLFYSFNVQSENKSVLFNWILLILTLFFFNPGESDEDEGAEVGRRQGDSSMDEEGDRRRREEEEREEKLSCSSGLKIKTNSQ